MSRLRLVTLGAVAVRDADDADLRAVAARSKDVALLVYLAVAARRGAVRRDTLLALFWPELDTQRARGALSQAVYRLRHALADDTIVSVGRDDLTLGDACWCDAAAFLERLERDEPARAIELYAGEFLPGFHLSGAPDFEAWCQTERDRLGRLAGEAAERLARDAEASGDLPEAVRWLRRRVEISVTDEAALRELVTVLDRMGDRAGAVRAYDEFADRLARTYELEPAPETRAVLEAVRGRGARGQPDATPDRERRGAAAGPRGSAGPGRRRSRVAGAVIAVAGVAAVVAWWFGPLGPLGQLPGSGLLEEGSRVLVADVATSTAEADLGLAVREALATDFDQSEHVRVVDRAELTGVLARMRRPDTAAIDEAEALEIARREGYAAVLAAGVTRIGTAYQVSARLLEAATGRAVARERETTDEETELVAAVERLSRRLRRRAGESLRSVRASSPLPQVTTASLEALTLLARAQEYARRAEWRDATRLAQQAVAIDTAFAAAHTTLAAWYDNLAHPTPAEHHARLAYVHAARLVANERLWATGRYHSIRGWEDSAAYYRQLVLDRDSTDFVVLVGLGNTLAGRGRDEEALTLFGRALEHAAHDVTTHNKVMTTLRKLGRDREADSVLGLMRARFPDATLTRIGEVARAMRAGDLIHADSLTAAMMGHGSDEVRVWGRALRIILASMRGRLRDAMRDADSAIAEALRLYGPQAASAFLRLIEYAALAAGAPERALSAAERHEGLLTASSRSLGGVRALAAVASAYAHAGRSVQARRVLAQMDSVVGAQGLRTGIGDEARAVVAQREGRLEDVSRHLARAREANFGTLTLMGEFALADASAALGRHQEAAAAYDRVLHWVPGRDYQTFYIGPMWPMAHERLGAVYEALGDTVAAIRHLRAFTDLWREADPELAPRVEAARRAMWRLGAERASRREKRVRAAARSEGKVGGGRAVKREGSCPDARPGLPGWPAGRPRASRRSTA